MSPVWVYLPYFWQVIFRFRCLQIELKRAFQPLKEVNKWRPVPSLNPLVRDSFFKEPFQKKKLRNSSMKSMPRTPSLRRRVYSQLSASPLVSPAYGASVQCYGISEGTSGRCRWACWAARWCILPLVQQRGRTCAGQWGWSTPRKQDLGGNLSGWVGQAVVLIKICTKPWSNMSLADSDSSALHDGITGTTAAIWTLYTTDLVQTILPNVTLTV